MARRKILNRSLWSVLLLFPLLVLSGCQQGLEVTVQEAKEVALDDAGYKEAEVKNLTTSETDSGYAIGFESNGRELQYDISDHGIIRSRTVEKLDNKVSESNGSDSSAQTQHPLPPVNQEAIQIALASQQLTEDVVTDLKATAQQNQVTVTFVYGGQHYSIVVDMATGQTISVDVQ